MLHCLSKTLTCVSSQVLFSSPFNQGMHVLILLINILSGDSITANTPSVCAGGEAVIIIQMLNELVCLSTNRCIPFFYLVSHDM